ncbi:hypothetical protein ACTMTI_52915 [Nonomuraea sp. H19]|uniref:hypothetical protein n=1 Tax=Nonomuraea sp. H19 TaxID=3452206 RepID=UPI003F8ABAD9
MAWLHGGIEVQQGRARRELVVHQHRRGQAARFLAEHLIGSASDPDGRGLRWYQAYRRLRPGEVSADTGCMALVRGELDALEAGLLQMARGRGMTWQEIAFGLGLGTAQAARQRCERLADRTDIGLEGPE